MGSWSTRRWFIVGIISIISGLSLGWFQSDRAINNRIDSLLSATDSDANKTFELDRITKLPKPVRRYFDAVIEVGQPYVHTIQVKQNGEFRLGGDSGSWKPMTATQYYSVHPPGFIWDAKIETVPWVPARVVDAYERGQGTLKAKLLSLIPVATAGPSPEMNEGELLRYLAEAVWFPTALLPGEGVQWQSIDAHSAKATLKDGDNTASLVFHFDDDGFVEQVSGERYRQEDGCSAPWIGRFEEYEWQGGLRIPMKASVEWDLPDGPFPYWRARVNSIKYNLRD